MSGIRVSLTDKLIEMLTLKGEELVLDVATGTGRVARPLSKQIKGGKIIGVDQAQRAGSETWWHTELRPLAEAAVPVKKN